MYFRNEYFAGVTALDGVEGVRFLRLGGINNGLASDTDYARLCSRYSAAYSICSVTPFTQSDCDGRDFFVGFSSGRGQQIHGWIGLRGLPPDLTITGWAYEDSGGPIVVGDTGMVPSPLYPTIQSAIDAASEGDVIRIAPGVHRETIDLRGKSLRFVGVGEPGEVVIDGGGVERPLTVSGIEGELAEFENLVFRNGVNVEDRDIDGDGVVSWWEMQGGGTLLVDAAVRFVDCGWEANISGRSGGGLYLYGTGSAVEFIGCAWVDNQSESAGGGIVAYGAALSLDGGSLEGNLSWSTGFGAGGILLSGGSQALIDGVRFEENRAPNASAPALAVVDASDVEIVGAEMVGHDAVQGAVIDVDRSSTGWIGSTTICDFSGLALSGSLQDLGDNCISQVCDADGDGIPDCDDGCPADYSGNGVVNGTDLGVWLAYAGKPCEPDIPCPGDLDGDGQITGGDLGVLLSSWGVCE